MTATGRIYSVETRHGSMAIGVVEGRVVRKGTSPSLGRLIGLKLEAFLRYAADKGWHLTLRDEELRP